MNDRCAAGTGKFLEFMATALQVPLEEFGDFALQADKSLQINSMCTVFAESEATSLMARGEKGRQYRPGPAPGYRPAHPGYATPGQRHAALSLCWRCGPQRLYAFPAGGKPESAPDHSERARYGGSSGGGIVWPSGRASLKQQMAFKFLPMSYSI